METVKGAGGRIEQIGGECNHRFLDYGYGVGFRSEFRGFGLNDGAGVGYDASIGNNAGVGDLLVVVFNDASVGDLLGGEHRAAQAECKQHSGSEEGCEGVCFACACVGHIIRVRVRNIIGCKDIPIFSKSKKNLNFFEKKLLIWKNAVLTKIKNNCCFINYFG